MKYIYIKVGIIIMFISLIGCSDESSNDGLDKEFDKIEKEYNFQKPLSDLAREHIIERYHNIDNFREAIDNQIARIKLCGDTVKSTVKSDKYYKVTLYMPDGEVDIYPDRCTYILDEALSDGIDLPYSCKAGACSSCVGRLLSGEVDQDEQTFLNEDQIAEGWVLLCVAFVNCNCDIETHQEAML